MFHPIWRLSEAGVDNYVTVGRLAPRGASRLEREGRDSRPAHQQAIVPLALSGQPLGVVPRPAKYRMINSLEVKNFRAFRDLQLDDLTPVNIVVGRSASGKTALLEAIRLALGATPQVAWNLNAWRGVLVGNSIRLVRFSNLHGAPIF
jgi:hypothetical protein